MHRVLRPVKLFVALCDAGRELPELLTIRPELDGIAPNPFCLLTPVPERLYGTLELLLGNGLVGLHRGSCDLLAKPRWNLGDLTTIGINETLWQLAVLHVRP